MLPHERTHARPKEDRLALLRATRTQLEPIFLLYDADPPVAGPTGEPEIDVDEGGVRTRVWRLDSDEIELDVPLLIADGHHRYETAVAFREEEPDGDPHVRRARLVALARARDLPDPPRSSSVERRPVRAHDLDLGHAARSRLPARATSSASTPTTSSTRSEIEQLRAGGIEYTPNAQQAVDAVDAGVAELGVPRPRADDRAGRSSSPAAARRCRRSRRSSIRS